MFVEIDGSFIYLRVLFYCTRTRVCARKIIKSSNRKIDKFCKIVYGR